jgi:hypothetical protein
MNVIHNKMPSEAKGTPILNNLNVQRTKEVISRVWLECNLGLKMPTQESRIDIRYNKASLSDFGLKISALDSKKNYIFRT